MDNFHAKLNDFFVESFNSILKLEEDVIRASGINHLTISELHMLEAIGKCATGENTVSSVAAQLNITMSSVTIGVNKLILKGFVEKSKNHKDGRSVRLHLTDAGQRMEALHRRFHEKMVEDLATDLTPEERQVLVSVMGKLADFFRKQRQEKRG